MITRPLDLAPKLRPEPRNFDWLFFVNAGLLVLFFSLFGSRFVLAPGLPLTFRLPAVAGANSHARPPSHVIGVISEKLVVTGDGLRKIDELEGWLKKQAERTKAPLLLVWAGEDLSMALLANVVNAAGAAGFEVIWAAGEPPAGKAP